jgi:3-dehydroquinate synthase
MKKIDITGKSSTSTILVGERLENLHRYLPVENPIIITDHVVLDLYRQKLPKAEIICIGTGEENKTLQTVESIYERLVQLGADRTAFIVGVGGGIVCDITGFVASTYLRGVRFGFVSSTLLAQVDASVGGKNGVNYHGYKNMVGVFNQPEFVLCDLELLQTLAEKEIQCGFAEIVKHAAIADADMFTFLENNAEQALALDHAIVEHLVSRSVSIKAAVVNHDEHERGERRKLNFGHTFGHAIEKVCGLPHGQAVSIGMSVAAALSVRRGLLAPEEATRLNNLLARLNLPSSTDAPWNDVLAALDKDKKREGQAIHFILLKQIGEAVVDSIPLEELRAVIPDHAC